MASEEQLTLGIATAIFDEKFGPESDVTLDPKTEYPGGKKWVYNGRVTEEKPVAFSEGLVVDYVAHRVYCPTPRKIDLSLGSDD